MLEALREVAAAGESDQHGFTRNMLTSDSGEAARLVRAVLATIEKGE